MKLVIALTVEGDIANQIVEEILDEYELRLIPGIPVMVMPDDDRVIFLCEGDNPLALEMLSIEPAVDMVWYDPDLYFSANTPRPSGYTDTVKKLEALLEKDVDLNSQNKE